MIGQFTNIQGRLVQAFYPGVGDTNILGTIITVFEDGGGLVCADANQAVPGSQWALGGDENPLILPFESGTFSVGQRVSFSVVAGTYSPVATNLTAL